jgi:hypothetical protein
MPWLERLFGKRPSPSRPGTRVLVCAFEDRFGPLVAEDAATYREFFEDTTETILEGRAGLEAALGKGADIVHLHGQIDAQGLVTGLQLDGTHLIEMCSRGGVKLLWIASDNDPAGYVNGFKAQREPINLVMTIERNGAAFNSFLRKLLSKMSVGQPMPVAWNSLAPQIPGAAHENAPGTIYLAGSGSARFR